MNLRAKGPRRTSTHLLRTGGAGVLLALLAGGFAGGCSGHHDVALPTKTPPSAPSATPTSAEDAVRQSYTQYWAILPQAEHADNDASRRELLARYSTEPQLSTALHGIDDLHSKDLTSSGYVVVHIQSVQVSGDQATVWDCQDATNALIQQRSTGKTLSRGVPNDHIRAALSRGSDGQWRISQFAPLSRC